MRYAESRLNIVHEILLPLLLHFGSRPSFSRSRDRKSRFQAADRSSLSPALRALTPLPFLELERFGRVFVFKSRRTRERKYSILHAITNAEL